MERFRQDLVLGFRSLLRQPGVSFVAILTLALGIGANVAMVSFARAILFPTLPYEDPARLVLVDRWTHRDDSAPYVALSYPAFLNWQEKQRMFSDLSLLYPHHVVLNDKTGDPERVRGLDVSFDIFETLGIEPFLGRKFTPQDDRLGADPTILVSFEFWRQRFEGAPEILGRVLHLDGRPHTVIGVLPPSLSTEQVGSTLLNDIWLPIVPSIEKRFNVHDRLVQDTEFVTVGRLRPGVSLASAQEDMTRICMELAQDYPASDQDKKAVVTPLREELVRKLRPTTLALVATVIFLLMIVCVNLINLLLARFVARQREFAVRTALGASRWRLTIQGLNEAMALALVGSLAGLVAAQIAIKSLPSILGTISYAQQARISPSILAYTFSLSLAVTLVIGLVPSMHANSATWRQLLTSSLASRASDHRRLRQALIIVEIALATTLVTATGLALTSLFNHRNELGFSTDQILTLEVPLPLSSYDKSGWVTYFDAAVEATRSLAEVEDVAVTSDIPMGLIPRASAVFADRLIPAINKRPLTDHFAVSSSYFHIMSIPIVEGRVFAAQDDDRLDSKLTIMVSQSLARRFWPGQSALGKEIAFEWQKGEPNMEKPDLVWREVIGVVADIRYRGVREDAPAVYVSYKQRPNWYDRNNPESPPMTLVAKTTVEPSAAIQAVRSALKNIDPTQPVYAVQPLSKVVKEEFAETKMGLVVLSFLAGLALVLALIGIYGVVSYLVTTRTQEIGIRMTVGASPGRILSHLLWSNFTLILIGVTVGLVLVAPLSRLVDPDQLHGVSPWDPRTLLLGGLLLILTALLATISPARRAARLGPSDALRHE